MAEKKKTRAVKKVAPKKKKAVKPAEAPPEALEAEAPLAEQRAPEPPGPALKPAPRPRKREIPKGAPRYYGTGRRKEATAKVWLTPGSGSITVNGKDYLEYFCNRKLLEYYVNRPLLATNTAKSYDVDVDAFGGGVPAQATAVSMGIARALLAVSPDFRIKLKREGLLRRDPRMKERKKYGLKRARRAFQYTKR